METKLIQPKAFTLPEIVLAIGKFIPLWVPEVIRGVTVWWFSPKDLVAAAAVNRFFHTLLTPILWRAFAYPCDRSHRYLRYQYREPRHFPKFAPEAIEKNSAHFRYLDLSLDYKIFRDDDDIFDDDDDILKNDNIIEDSFKFEQLQLSCTRLQELKITTSVDIAFVRGLINTNPGLRLLQYVRIHSDRNGLLSLLFPLCHLQSLLLKGDWGVDSICLHHVLSNNAASLEELELGSESQILNTPPMNAQWNGLEPSALSSMKEDRRVKAVKLIQGRPLLLPKLKTLSLRVNWYKTCDATYTLVRAFPALETIILEHVYEDVASRLGRNLQEFCPNLRSIQNPNRYYEARYPPLVKDDGLSYVVNACSPGNLVRVTLGRGLYKDQGMSDLFESLKDCRELESVALVGFPYVVIASLDNIDDEVAVVERYWRKNRDEQPPFAETMPTNWRYVPEPTARRVISMSTKEFRILCALAYTLVRAFPALKSITLGYVHYNVGLQLGKVL
ncbi:hypothetical protein BGZ95_000488 [Linnemannia exigua]|uniref:F-box domain-containing protein n=1 Tax=Linnemannia exigua TaxID=604196 RepID=A0AAD4D864_9FUNG|nr:hypothetical protein BGZ95_000488 [Linnemannia exigua]